MISSFGAFDIAFLKFEFDGQNPEIEIHKLVEIHELGNADKSFDDQKLPTRLKYSRNHAVM